MATPSTSTPDFVTYDLISKRNAFGIAILEPFVGGISFRENLDVITVSNFLTGVDVDPD